MIELNSVVSGLLSLAHTRTHRCLSVCLCVSVQRSQCMLLPIRRMCVCQLQLCATWTSSIVSTYYRVFRLSLCCLKLPSQFQYLLFLSLALYLLLSLLLSNCYAMLSTHESTDRKVWLPENSVYDLLHIRWKEKEREKQQVLLIHIAYTVRERERERESAQTDGRNQQVTGG